MNTRVAWYCLISNWHERARVVTLLKLQTDTHTNAQAHI